MSGNASDIRLPDDIPGVAVPAAMWPELRSDHAGETGAVWIYKGVLAVTRDTEVRDFARQHLATESEHLLLMERLVPQAQRSKLLPVWRVAGWLTGALPAIVGPGAVFQTIDAVETFVDLHYAAQTSELEGNDRFSRLHGILERCRLDEVEHREDARRRQVGQSGRLGRLWAWLVGHGSKAGVAIACRL